MSHESHVEPGLGDVYKRLDGFIWMVWMLKMHSFFCKVVFFKSNTKYWSMYRFSILLFKQHTGEKAMMDRWPLNHH